jgi:hypothetical protein
VEPAEWRYHPIVMVRRLQVPLVGASIVAALAGCASGNQPTNQADQPSSRVISRAASPAQTSSPPAANPSPPAAVTSPTPPRPPVPKGTGIAGRTVLMNCPADRADPSCAGVPVRAELAVLNATTQAVITDVNTDAQGNFTVALPAGSYLLRPVKVGSQAARRPVATMIKVTAGQYTSITLRINNGLQ